MSRRGDPRRVAAMPRPQPASPQDLLQAFQQQMQQVQAALENETLQVSAGGGAVTVVISGQQKIQSITIAPEVFSAGDVEMLQDLIVAAVNQAIEKSQQLAASRMNELTGGLGLPNMLGL
jgi:DNA-binding YbaB/EbfC family protein